jgi:hypothetical protein
MSSPAEVRLARRVLRHELEAIKAHWVWFLALGIVLIAVGTVAVGDAFRGFVSYGCDLRLAALGRRNRAASQRVLDP